MDIACIGAGPAGLYFSMLMKRSDPAHRVVVYERNPRACVTGWGMGVWDELLTELGDSDPQTARSLRDNAVRWRGQNLVLDGERVNVDAAGYGISRSKLLDTPVDRALEVGVDIRFEATDTRIEDLRDADVMVAADGANSAVRGRAADVFGTEFSVGRNKYVWLGTDRQFDAFTFGFRRTGAGWIWLHGYAIDTATSTCIVECSPKTWQRLGFDTLSAEDSLRLLENIFSDVLAGGSLFNQEAERLAWRNFTTITNSRWWSGNTVLLGDAAHTAHFSIGSGTRLALQGAIALAGCLAEHPTPQTGFNAYQRRRRAAVLVAQREAWFSERWLENVERYGAMPPHEFFTLLRARRDPLLTQIPPALYCRLHSAAEGNPVLRRLKSQWGPKVRRSYGRLARLSA